MTKKQKVQELELDVRVSEEDQGTCVVECAGEVDIETAPALGQALDLASEQATHRVELDLRRVTAMDSVGVGQIVRLAKRLRAGVEVRVRTNSQRVCMLLQMANLGSLIAPQGKGLGRSGV